MTPQTKTTHVKTKNKSQVNFHGETLKAFTHPIPNVW